MMSRPAKRFYLFDVFRVDALERILFKGNTEVPLTPKVFDTLLVLLQNSSHVLTKKELMHQVWPDSFVEENNLAQNISILRKALGENFIQTVPKRGYRFVGDVTTNTGDDEALIVRERTRARIVVDSTDDEDLTVGAALHGRPSHDQCDCHGRKTGGPRRAAPTINSPKGSAKMKCPFCGYLEDKVVDSRESREGDAIRRRRECLRCERRFTSYERIDEIPYMVVKKDGRRETFDRNKVMAGLLRACEKRPVPSTKLDSIVNAIEKYVQESSERERPTSKIGEMIMRRLKELDKVAYVRFASVYLEFEDVSEFMTELKNLVRTRNTGPAGKK